MDPVHSDEREPGGALILDFGASATTVAFAPSPASDQGRKGDWNLVRDALPWTHCTYHPAKDDPLRKGQINRQAFAWTDNKDLAEGLFPIVPERLRVGRKPIPRGRQLAATPSLLYALKEGVDEPVTADKENAIGHEAAAMLATIGSGVGFDPNRFVFSPKRLVGQDAGAATFRHREGHPVELYLRELFDEAVNSMLITENPARLKPLERVCYSYPVTWTKDRRNKFRQSVQNAIESSELRQYIRSVPFDRLFADEYAMDEASAAFLGFVNKRFVGLEGQDIVRTFAAFNPSPAQAGQYPKSMHVLVFDCGEATTDMVLLEIRDMGQGDVVSSVKRHFAIEKAGLEVTRRIAKMLKAHYRECNPIVDVPKDPLRTNLKDTDIDRDFVFGNTTKEDFRRGLIIDLYREAERLKIELSRGGTPQINWASIKNTPFQTPKTASIPAEQLDRITREVFKTPFGRIREWLRDGPAVDIVLMSGRSSRLPGVREGILNAIPPEKRPYEVDFVSGESMELEETAPVATAYGESSKTVVAQGLVQNFRNKSGTNRRALRCCPIDETLRTRAFGVMASDNAGRTEADFTSSPLLVEPDNDRIDPAAEPFYDETNTTSHGFTIGMNFCGKRPEEDDGDLPQPYLHIKIDGGDSGVFAKLRFVFQQRSATDLSLKRVELYKEPDGQPVRSPMADNADLVKVGPLTVACLRRFDVDDFRVTGRIHEGIDNG